MMREKPGFTLGRMANSSIFQVWKSSPKMEDFPENRTLRAKIGKVLGNQD